MPYPYKFYLTPYYIVIKHVATSITSQIRVHSHIASYQNWHFNLIICMYKYCSSLADICIQTLMPGYSTYNSVNIYNVYMISILAQ